MRRRDWIRAVVVAVAAAGLAPSGACACDHEGKDKKVDRARDRKDRREDVSDRREDVRDPREDVRDRAKDRREDARDGAESDAGK